jgi:hypothetical protein
MTWHGNSFSNEPSSRDRWLAMNSGSARWDRDALLANPVFESLWPVIALCPSDRFPGTAELSDLARARGVVSGGGAALRFVSDRDSVPGAFEQQYEVRIYRDGEVRTRPDSVHDLCNALVWLAFPKTKALLNRKHYEAMMAREDAGSGRKARQDHGSRGTTRDVLTLFDESGVIVVCSEPELEALLRGFEWKALFWTRRAEVGRAMRFFLFGHGIHEKALRPFKGLTAKALILPVSRDFLGMPLESQLAQTDARAADCFAQPRALTSTHVLAPVPVLGVPGWDAANESEAYYDDASVFRPGRRLHRG